MHVLVKQHHSLDTNSWYTYGVVYSVGVDKVGQQVTAPQEKDFSQHMWNKTAANKHTDQTVGS